MNIFSRMKRKKNPKSPAQKTASKIKKRYSKGYVKTDKGHRIWNIDETGFTMGSKPGKVIGPVKSVAPVDCPDVSGGSSKERLIVLYSANAEGSMMPPFFVYPEPKPRSYNPMKGA